MVWDATSRSQWCDEYEAIYAKRTENEGSRSTVSSYLKAIKRAPFAAQRINVVTPKDIRDFLKKVAAEVSDTYAVQMRSRLVDLFNEAIGEGLIEAGKNPVSSVKRTKGDVLRSRLTLEDFRKVVAEARKDPLMGWAARAFMLALVTAQRREDVKSMLFDQVKDGFLYVEQKKSQGRTRLKIPLTVGLKALDGLTIGDVIRECRDNIVSKHVIHHLRHIGTARPGGSPHVVSFSDVFATFRDQAKIAVDPGKTPPTFHEIRSLAARLYADEYGAEFAQALLGHKSAEMTALYRDSRGKEWTEIKVSQG
jgi:integrase